MPSYISRKYTFEVGQKLYSEYGDEYTITGLLGRGGQGEVYKVVGNGGEFAVKWYYADSYLKKINAAAFKSNLERNVENGLPTLSSGDSATQFIWPLKMIKEQYGSFGYLMNLFPQGFEPLKNVIFGRKINPVTGLKTDVRFESWFARVTAALNIVRAFEILHATGHSYQDVNDGGFSINMKTGDVFICDCDNVSPDKTNLGILGMKTFMAPEVVVGDKLPDHYTDEYSIAVILFRLFLHGHPMIGQESRMLHNSDQYTDKQSDLMIYGQFPHYCLASQNNVNPIDPKIDQDVFRLSLTYPTVLMDAFEQIFTEGITDVYKRLTATEWRKVLLNVRDHIIINKDGFEQFCGKRFDDNIPEECRIFNYRNKKKVYCMPGKILYDYHFNERSRDFKKPIGKIITTSKPGVIGLYNAYGKDIIIDFKGKKGICPDKGKIPLFKGMTLEVNNSKINIT